ncbi:MAG: hypothetical protein ACREYC_23125, partial [Gammaproteobacteria bacterium]
PTSCSDATAPIRTVIDTLSTPSPALHQPYWTVKHPVQAQTGITHRQMIDIVSYLSKTKRTR